MTQHVFLFEQGHKDLKDLLGGKGANLAEMTRLGLPVPPGFTITTQACLAYLETEQTLSSNLQVQVIECLISLEKATGKGFGDTVNPLLVSVRSGAKVSMPGMMETILNLGLNDDTVQGLIAQTQSPRFAYDSYRRLISMMGEVVFGLDKELFESEIEKIKRCKGVALDTELEAEDWQALVETFKIIFKEYTGNPFPQCPKEQLWCSIEAVFKSWNIPRAVAYRKHHNIPHDLGTAVNIQSMVFGNMGEDCATGVAFTRNPATGEKGLYGEYLVNAQGEDVVAGIRTPQPIVQMKETMPALYRQLESIAGTLETHYKDMQDIEFTIEKNRLYMLQTRAGKRTAHAAVRVAVDLVEEGVLSEEDALLMLNADQLPQILLPMFDKTFMSQHKDDLLGTGLGASPGAAVGKIVFNPDEAERLGNAGEAVILVRPETVPDDIHGMIASVGILTSRGGTTSHAAVVARGMGKPCVTGCEAMMVDLKHETLVVKDLELKKGEIISLDGATGEVFLGALPMMEAATHREFDTIMTWSDGYRQLKVRANADTPEDAVKARSLGATGIGLCRTEHMFMATDRLPVMRKMILADNVDERRLLLEKLLPMQLEDFKGIFRAMEGHPVTIRLLDPPLHEFLPNIEELIEETTRLRTVAPDTFAYKEKQNLLKKLHQLKESNPMLGFRGCRLGLLYPEINEMQVKAIFEAATDLIQEGIEVYPEIMIPLVGTAEELKRLRYQLETIAQRIMTAKNVHVDYLFGTMIEVPRAALVADDIAEYADFFSFGTNDLTQMTFGYSRDDAEGRFLSAYLDSGILPNNPFETLDQDGVGQLIRLAKEKGQRVRSALKLGICGEHGGDARSVAFCHQAGLHYVSCSPYRVPVARLSAAQAAIREAREQRAMEPLPELVPV